MTALPNDPMLVNAGAMLAESGLFDADWYWAQPARTRPDDPIRHYVETGWSAGYEPNPTFPGSFLLPYFESVGFVGPPAVTWVTLKTAGWALPDTRADAEEAARVVRDSDLFDSQAYRQLAALETNDLDPAMHYILVGERLGNAPCLEFDPLYYAERWPDIRAAGYVSLVHYIQHGRAEGRRALPVGLGRRIRAPDPDKGNVLLVLHETSRTGAPILGWNVGSRLATTYNVFTFHLGAGELTPAFESFSTEMIGPFVGADRTSVEISHSIRRLLGRASFEYAVVNSAESRLLIEPLALGLVPTILLMHEFAGYVFPIASLRRALDWASEIVFPAPVVARAALAAHPALRAREIRIMPQGVQALPDHNAEAALTEGTTLAALRRRREQTDLFLVLGAGLIQIRKGVDLFLSAAATVMRANPTRPFHFLWVGQGYRPQEDMGYSVYLREQLQRSGLAEHVTFHDEVTDLETVYRIADAFLLTSRLDPLPNVSIDAAVRGIPIICFREASGMADLLLADPDTADCVVGHLDAEAAGHVILVLMDDQERCGQVGRAMQGMAKRSFDIDAYVTGLDDMGRESADVLRQRAQDAATLSSDSSFNQEMFLGPAAVIEARQQSILRYLNDWAAWGTVEPGVAETALRRPCPGFNPRVYRSAHASHLTHGVDPLADFVRRGCPSGPWQAQILGPGSRIDRNHEPSRARAAIHAHFFYVDLAADFLSRLQLNRAGCDLLVSTDDPAKAECLERVLSQHKTGRLKVVLVPNRGRDIAPLLTALRDELSSYDLVGHLHAKRSAFSGSEVMGDSWREFLWQNLIGGRHAMVDEIVAGFDCDPSIGLMFPSDPHVLGWGGNRTMAATVAERMGWQGTLPEAFDFPVGTMFWARTAALRPLLDLQLEWEDYPPEPVPWDGTILHALERLLPFAARLAGFNYAVTHVPGVSWAP